MPYQAADTARGLAYLHGRVSPVCHGDIKAVRPIAIFVADCSGSPTLHQANTLVNDRHQAMLCDFGLARILEENPSGLTTRSAQIGTLRYVSPELMMSNNARHTRESDVWAWACLLLEVRTQSSFACWAEHSSRYLHVFPGRHRPNPIPHGWPRTHRYPQDHAERASRNS